MKITLSWQQLKAIFFTLSLCILLHERCFSLKFGLSPFYNISGCTTLQPVSHDITEFLSNTQTLYRWFLYCHNYLLKNGVRHLNTSGNYFKLLLHHLLPDKRLAFKINGKSAKCGCQHCGEGIKVAVKFHDSPCRYNIFAYFLYRLSSISTDAVPSFIAC